MGAARVSKKTKVKRLSTGIPELDEVLGGGLVPGSVTLLVSECGAGKTTFALQVAGAHPKCVYVSGEQTVADLERQADRVGVSVNCFRDDVDVEAATREASDSGTHLLVVDSVQTARVGGRAVGTPSCIRAVVNYLHSFAEEAGVVVLVIGHTTADGGIACPSIANSVDAVVWLVNRDVEDSDGKVTELREVWVEKNRHGPGQVGAFLEMTSAGLRSPSAKARRALARSSA